MNPHSTWQLDDRLIGRLGRVYDCVSSTNSLALEEAENEANDGLVIRADRQTSGRGQHGRTWTAPAGSSVLMSLLVFPPPALLRPALLTAWAGVSVAAVVEQETGLPPTLKWPNDVLLGGKKVCGILIEQRRGVVVGLGLNLNQSQSDFGKTGLPEATSLYLATRTRRDAGVIAGAVLDHMETLYREMLAGSLESLESQWRKLLGLEGRAVTAECHSGEIRGVVRRLRFEGIDLDQGGGASCRLLPESIRHLTPQE